jgi:hypothetical protein
MPCVLSFLLRRVWARILAAIDHAGKTPLHQNCCKASLIRSSTKDAGDPFLLYSAPPLRG